MKRIQQVLGYVTSGLIIATGISLILSCVHIYQSGQRPFSREVVAQSLGRIAPLTWACFLCVVAGGVLSLMIPADKRTAKPLRDARDALCMLREKAGSVRVDASAEVTREIRLRRNYSLGTGLLIVAAWIYPAIYIADGAHFTDSNLNQSVIRCVAVFLSAAAVSFLLLYLLQRLVLTSIRRETAVLKELIATGTNSSVSTSAETKKNNGLSLLIVRCVGLILAVVFICLGIINGGIMDVLGKAIAICTECIGLG